MSPYCRGTTASRRARATTTLWMMIWGKKEKAEAADDEDVDGGDGEGMKKETSSPEEEEEEKEACCCPWTTATATTTTLPISSQTTQEGQDEDEDTEVGASSTADAAAASAAGASAAKRPSENFGCRKARRSSIQGTDTLWWKSKICMQEEQQQQEVQEQDGFIQSRRLRVLIIRPAQVVEELLLRLLLHERWHQGAFRVGGGGGDVDVWCEWTIPPSSQLHQKIFVVAVHNKTKTPTTQKEQASSGPIRCQSCRRCVRRW